MSPKRAPRLDSQIFKNLVEEAGEEIRASFRRSIIGPEHNGTRGTIRENGFAEFLRRVLPGQYSVSTGFAFDSHDNQTKQLDILIAADPPMGRLFEKDGLCYIPCESLLAVIEVKTRLTKGEVRKCFKNASSVRGLVPYGEDSFVGPPGRGGVSGSGSHRCFYGVAALDSDLSVDDWNRSETERAWSVATELGIAVDSIDRLIVVDRGILNLPARKHLSADFQVNSSIYQWYVHLANFLDREAGRRKPVDVNVYGVNEAWRST